MAEEYDAAEEALARELQELRPSILRQQRADAVRPDPLFAQSLRARLVGTPEAVPVLERLRRVIATLVPPAQPRLALAGVRSTGTAPQPVTYAAEDVQVAISMEQGAQGTVTLRGMIVSAALGGEDLAATRVAVLRDEAVEAAAQVDEFGMFTVVDISPGTYALQVSFPDRLLSIPALAIGG